MKRRGLRLIPAYYVAIVIVLLFWPTPTSWGDLLAHLTFTQGFTPAYARTMSPAFWSLTPEIVFYALLPFIIVWLPKIKHRIFLLVALFALAMPTRFLAISNRGERGADYDYGEMNPFEFYTSFPTTLLYLFIVGMVLRAVVERLDTGPASLWRARVSFALFVASATYILTTPQLATLLLGGFGQTTARLGNFVLSDLTVAGFFASAVLGAPILRGILRWRPLAFVGLVSYSMFVFHQTVLLLVKTHILRLTPLNRFVTQNPSTEWLVLLCYLLGTFGIILLVSYLGYRFVESPFLHRKPK